MRRGAASAGWWWAAVQWRRRSGPRRRCVTAELARITDLETPPTERPAVPGERCTCGRQAIVVYLGSVFGTTGYCGIPDGGDRAGPCPFCGSSRHREPYGRCPDYRLRLDQP